MEKNNPAAVALLHDIVAWSKETGSTGSQLGQMVLNHGGFVPLLQKRGSLKPETDDLLRAFMATFPTKATLPATLVAKLKETAVAGMPWRPERHRSMMIRFGVVDARPVGEAKPQVAMPPEPAQGGASPEGKPRISAAVIRAAKLDGRDLPTFVTRLIEMGLECWRDDRVEHGEAVA